MQMNQTDRRPENKKKSDYQFNDSFSSVAQDLVPPPSTLPTVNTESIGQSNTLHIRSLH